MRLLLLQHEDDPGGRAAAQELFSIEQYVEMALQYQRLGSSATACCAAARSTTSCARRCANTRRCSSAKSCPRYEPCTARVLTDEKWLLFVVEQVLSNALKYTNTRLHHDPRGGPGARHRGHRHRHRAGRIPYPPAVGAAFLSPVLASL
jgi:signal transduction histidine kinase